MDNELHESKDSKMIPMTSIASGMGVEVRNDVFYYTNQMVNVSFIGTPGTGDWYMIDGGLPKSAAKTRSIVEERFGGNSKPAAIILTHGHFDHVGGLVELVQEWDVPVYAHTNEIPFLTGEKSYPEPDASVEGGLLAKISPMYPNEPIQLGNHVKPLPEDQSVPGLPEWKWIHTPGHSPGHVSFFREHDRTLLAGDAFITVKQDSFYKVLTQTEEINGPPRYLTTDWYAAKDSVRKLAELNPELAVTGHGPYMEGESLSEGLQQLVEHFDEIAIPDYGKYI